MLKHHPKKANLDRGKKEAVCELCHKDMVNNHSCFVYMWVLQASIERESDWGKTDFIYSTKNFKDIVWEMIEHSIHVKAMQARKAAIFSKEVGILEVIFEGV